MAMKFVEKNTNVQKETTYILYMIIGSLFKKCVCKSVMMENTLVIAYREMGSKKSEEREAKIIDAVDKALESIKDELAELQCEVEILKKDKVYKMAFDTGFECINIVVDESGRFQISIVEA